MYISYTFAVKNTWYKVVGSFDLNGEKKKKTNSVL